MIKLRPWKGSKNEFEVDVIVSSTQGRTLRRRVRAPVTGRTNAERWARALEQELFAQILAPEPKAPDSGPEKRPPPTFEEFARVFLDLCETDRLAINTRMNYDVHLRHYLLQLRRAGASLRQVALALTAEGFRPRGRRWHPTSILRVVRRDEIEHASRSSDPSGFQRR